jgi:hypothetical protein
MPVQRGSVVTAKAAPVVRLWIALRDAPSALLRTRSEERLGVMIVRAFDLFLDRERVVA